MDVFRFGLNDDIKDILATSFEEPQDLDNFINFCIKIDQRLYDRKLDRGHYQNSRNISSGYNNHPKTSFYRGPIPSDRDQRGSSSPQTIIFSLFN